MTAQNSNTSFNGLGLNSSLLSRIKMLGYQTPTAIQLRAIPIVLEGKDLKAQAKTGSGKTAAFGLPMLQRLMEEPNEPTHRGNIIKGLILAPTRELAIQIAKTIEQYAHEMKTKPKILAVFGGVKINPQMIALRGGADILVATPGRLLDLLSSNALSLKDVQTLVLDEADKMLTTSFKDEINGILGALPNTLQTLLFSATFPDDLKLIMHILLVDPVEVSVEALHKEAQIKQRVITVNREKKNALLIHLVNIEQWSQALIFCSAKKSCNNLAGKLKKAGLDIAVFHGDQSQGARNKALRDFKQGDVKLLIATDVAARGIDIEGLPYVINFELPRSPNDYIHRIGRTGRAGESGTAISLISHDDYAHFKIIEKRIKQRLPREQISGFEADENMPEGTVAPAKAKAAGQGKKNRPKVNNHIWGSKD